MSTASKKYKDQIKGGRADKRKPSEFDQKQLKMGVQHELEHTKDKQLAKEIAMDHLVKDPKYYTHLEAMEKKHGR